jgi:hypothetical protein
MTFGKSRYNKSDDWELIRYCSTHKVVGGASKMMKYFLEKYRPTKLISYSDNRYFTGKVYEEMGFSRVAETIGYYYTDYHKRYNRLQFQKHKLVQEGYDKSLTEWEIMQQKKYDRIWDCGQITWIKNFR